MKTLLSVPWQSPARYLLLVVSLTLFWMLRYSLADLVSSGNALTPWDLLLIPFVLVAVASAYAALADTLNTTCIQSDGRHLRVRHVPCPWPSPAPLALEELSTLCVATRVRSSDSRQMVTYKIEAVLKTGRKVELFRVPTKNRAQEYLRTLKEKLQLA